MKHADVRARRFPAVVAILLIVAGAIMLVSCGGAKTYEVYVPKGEWQTKSGTVLEDIPQSTEKDGTTVLRFSLGDTLVVNNDDTVEHMIGLIVVRPGETVRHTFSQRGSFEGACTLLTGQMVRVEVT